MICNVYLYAARTGAMTVTFAQGTNVQQARICMNNFIRNKNLSFTLELCINCNVKNNTEWVL